MRAHWGTLLTGYFGKRESLLGTIVVMDVRHPLTDHDQDMLKLATSRNLPVHILLTKADKLGRGAAGNALQGVRRKLPRDGLVTVQLFSAHSGDGVQEARGALASEENNSNSSNCMVIASLASRIETNYASSVNTRGGLAGGAR